MSENTVKRKRNTEGLKPPFPKGVSGNPNGRPPIPKEEKTIREYLQTANQEVVKELIESGRYKELLKKGLENTIAAGKMDGVKFVNDYNGNKPIEQVESNVVQKTTIELSKEEKKEFIRKYLNGSHNNT